MVEEPSEIVNGRRSASSVTVAQPTGTGSGNPLKVTVAFTYSGLGPVAFMSKVVGPITMRSTAVMNYE